MGVTTTEFPLLGAYGLYVADTIGNGNCLFNALSDQLYGDQSRHHDIRATTIKYMRDHAAFYKQFVDVHPGGGTRRNPKRKNAGAYSTPVRFVAPTAEEIERVFESHLQQMARGGTYGDNMEIVAFCSAYKVDVKIYQRDFAYLVPVTHEEKAERVVHIAYHTWEHYSSIRNVDGPHTGPPDVKETHLSQEAFDENQRKLADSSIVMPWMIEAVIKSTPFYADRLTIRKLLEKHRGSVDMVVSELLDGEYPSSESSAHGSSSVERDQDSDNEGFSSGPNKKQDRRLSRAARQQMKGVERSRKQDLTLRPKPSPLSPISQQYMVVKPEPIDPDGSKDSDETEEEDWESMPPTTNSHSPQPTQASRSLSVPSKPGPRLKFKTSRRREDATSETREHSSSSRAESSPNDEVKPKVRPLSPRRRIVSRNQRDMMKKAAQKAAAKERKRAVAASQNGSSPLPASLAKKGKENTPGLETSITVLYI